MNETEPSASSITPAQWGIVALVMLPLLGLMMLPFAFPLLLMVGLIWLLTRSAHRPIPVTIRR